MEKRKESQWKWTAERCNRWKPVRLLLMALLKPDRSAKVTSLQNRNREARTPLRRTIDSLSSFLEVRLFCVVDIDKSLWISVDHREPGALNLHHQPMTLLERVENVIQDELDLGHLIRHEWLGC